jgi:hypothetical protein
MQEEKRPDVFPQGARRGEFWNATLHLPLPMADKERERYMLVLLEASDILGRRLGHVCTTSSAGSRRSHSWSGVVEDISMNVQNIVEKCKDTTPKAPKNNNGKDMDNLEDVHRTVPHQ